MKEVKKDIIKKLRVNQGIRAREVRLVGEKGEQLGIMPLSQALEMARTRGLDLVEVAATAVPPVCRILDYGKYKYQQSKKERELRRSQRVSALREVRLRPAIDEHDREAKTRTISKLLNQGDKVKLTVMFRGREVTHSEIGWRLLQKITESLKDVASVEKPPMMAGNRMFIVLVPVSNKAKVKEEVKGS